MLEECSHFDIFNCNTLQSNTMLNFCTTAGAKNRSQIFGSGTLKSRSRSETFDLCTVLYTFLTLDGGFHRKKPETDPLTTFFNRHNGNRSPPLQLYGDFQADFSQILFSVWR